MCFQNVNMKIIIISAFIAFLALTVRGTICKDYPIEKPVLNPPLNFAFMQQSDFNVLIQLINIPSTITDVLLTVETIDPATKSDYKWNLDEGHHYRLCGELDFSEVTINLKLYSSNGLCATKLVAEGRNLKTLLYGVADPKYKSNNFCLHLPYSACGIEMDLLNECRERTHIPKTQNIPNISGTSISRQNVPNISKSTQTRSDISKSTNNIVNTSKATRNKSDTQNATRSISGTSISRQNTLDTSKTKENTPNISSSKHNMSGTRNATRNTSDTPKSRTNVPNTSKSTQNTSDTSKSTHNTSDTSKSTQNITNTSKATRNMLDTQDATRNTSDIPKSRKNVPNTSKSIQNITTTSEATRNMLDTRNATRKISGTSKSTQNISNTANATSTVLVTSNARYNNSDTSIVTQNISDTFEATHNVSVTLNSTQYFSAASNAKDAQNDADIKNYTTIIVSAISGMAVFLLVIIAIWKCCWIRPIHSGSRQLITSDDRSPFYLNLLFRKECDEEIELSEQNQYEEINPQY